MSAKPFRRLILPTLWLLVVAVSLRAQAPAGIGVPLGGAAIPAHGPLGADLHGMQKQTWNIFGKVTDVKGEPLRGVTVHVDIGNGRQYIKELTTNVQGEFRTEYNLESWLFPRLSVNLQAEREGFHPAREFVDFGAGDKTWEIDIAMRPESEGADDLPVEALVGRLAPPLRARLESDPNNHAVEKDLKRGALVFLDDQDPVKAVPSLDKVVKRRPDCGDCRTLLALALLQSGSWSGASREFAEAAKLADASGTAEQKVTSLLILAELEDWRGEYAKGAGFLMKARGLDTKNAFVLQELGRTLIFQGNWEAAEQYLAAAARAGAPRETHLLRARALLEEGDPEAAETEMKAYLGNEGLAAFPLSVRNLYAQIQTRLDLRRYAKVKSLADEPLPALVKAVPELKGLEPAAGQEELPSILAKAGENVQAFFLNFPNTISVEQVREERLGRGGKARDWVDQKFQYLLLARPEKWGLGLEEFRTDQRGERAAPTGLASGFMLTTGFASASLIFHPAYQTGSTFRYLGRAACGGRPCYVVAFAQNPEKAQMVERFNADKDTVLVLFQGLAWIDAETYRIVRMRTDLLKPQPRIRLARQTTEIRFDPVEFKQVAAALWLPSEVTVTVEWRGKTYRNLHHYADFKLFNTDAKEKIHPVAPTPPT